MTDDSTSISWESVHKISYSWVDVLIVYVLLLTVVISRWVWQRNNNCAWNLVQILETVCWRPCQWLDKRSRKKAGAVHGYLDDMLGSGRRQVKIMLIIFFLTSTGLFTKNPSLQTKQSIPHITVTFYGDCMKKWEGIAPNFGNKRTGYCIMTTHYLTLPFSSGNFWPKTTRLSSPLTILFCFPNWR
jgi:hypothetical protein